MHDNTRGLWFSEDPSGTQLVEPNLYLYCRNDPINNIDPSGLQPQPATEIVVSDKKKEERVRSYLGFADEFLKQRRARFVDYLRDLGELKMSRQRYIEEQQSLLADLKSGRGDTKFTRNLLDTVRVNIAEYDKMITARTKQFKEQDDRLEKDIKDMLERARALQEEIESQRIAEIEHRSADKAEERRRKAELATEAAEIRKIVSERLQQANNQPDPRNITSEKLAELMNRYLPPQKSGNAGPTKVMIQIITLAASSEGSLALLYARGEFNQAAQKFFEDVKKMFSNQDGYTQEQRFWIGEAARHYYWQMMLTARFGPQIAKIVGDHHELDVNPWADITVDRIVDTYHNKRAQEDARKYYDELLAGIQEELKTLRDLPEESRDRAYSLIFQKQWNKMKDRVETEVKAYIIQLIKDAVAGKDVDHRVIVSPKDPFLKRGTGLCIPWWTPPGSARPGWDQKP